MKTTKGILFLLIVLGMAVVPAAAQSNARAGFERMKALVGEWQGTAGNGKAATVSYRLVSTGSALEETLTVGREETMVTVYHLDGDRLMLTHYCASGNQPRMVGTPAPGNPTTIAFNFLDATNLPSPDTGHMHSVVVTLVDKDHFTQQWTWREKGKEDKWEVFKLTRK